MSFTESMYKNEVAEMLNVCPTTLRTWLNDRYFDELEQIGYQKRQKKLNPKQLNYLREKIDLQPV